MRMQVRQLRRVQRQVLRDMSAPGVGIAAFIFVSIGVAMPLAITWAVIGGGGREGAALAWAMCCVAIGTIGAIAMALSDRWAERQYEEERAECEERWRRYMAE